MLMAVEKVSSVRLWLLGSGGAPPDFEFGDTYGPIYIGSVHNDQSIHGSSVQKVVRPFCPRSSNCSLYSSGHLKLLLYLTKSYHMKDHAHFDFHGHHGAYRPPT